MNHAELCPVCKGEGKKEKFQVVPTTSASKEFETCNGCGGRGWITVTDIKAQEVYYSNWPYTLYPPHFEVWYGTI